MPTHHATIPTANPQSFILPTRLHNYVECIHCTPATGAKNFCSDVPFTLKETTQPPSPPESPASNAIKWLPRTREDPQLESSYSLPCSQTTSAYNLKMDAAAITLGCQGLMQSAVTTAVKVSYNHVTQLRRGAASNVAKPCFPSLPFERLQPQ